MASLRRLPAMGPTTQELQQRATSRSVARGRFRRGARSSANSGLNIMWRDMRLSRSVGDVIECVPVRLAMAGSVLVHGSRHGPCVGAAAKTQTPCARSACQKQWRMASPPSPPVKIGLNGCGMYTESKRLTKQKEVAECKWKVNKMGVKGKPLERAW